MAKDRFTGFGLIVALLGWVVLVADAALSPFLVSAGNMVMVASLRSDVFSVAETAIFSGFALAIIGVLRSGFGALHRFFDAVLERASTPRTGTAAPQPPLHAQSHAQATAQPYVQPHGHANGHATHGAGHPPGARDHAPVVTVLAEPVQVMERPAQAAAPSRPKNYVILANGAVEVETLLGTRVFASLDEARDYIR